MKKTLLLLASVALLLVGCQKENFVERQDGKLVDATFTASLESGVATRAAVDGDGAAASVNRCIMEIYYGDALFTRKIVKVTDKKATFTVQVVSNRTYTVAFWADKVDDASTDAGLAADKYYTTNATGGLQSISIKKITDEQLYIGNNDARDAFYHVGEYTVAQAGSSFGGGEPKILLKRPFAQVNVITTDLQIIKPVPALKPEGVDVLIKNAYTGFNVLTETVSTPSNLTYTAALYNFPETISTQTDATLSMDYLFASKDKAVIDIDWKALHGNDANVEHSFAAVPYQRNYRTNIKGALLTTQGQWTVTVDPQWAATEYDVPFLSASTITEAQNYIGTGGSETSKKVVDLSKATIKTTDLVGSEGDKKIEFKLMTTSPADMVSFTLPAIPTEVTDAGCTGWKITYEPNYPTKNVNVTAPTGTNVVIEAPTSHVTLNGVSYGQVTATTGASTLVVPAGVTVKNLTVKKGAVEIHGTVEALTVTPDEDAKVVFRACEGLSAGVFEKIYKESDNINYIDPMYAYKQVGENYDIYKLPVVAMIGDVEYPSLAAALAAVQANETIEVVAESVELPAISKADITLKGNGATKVTKFGGLTGKNVTLDGFEFTVQINPNAENFAIKNSKFTGNNGLRYAYAKGNVLIENCVFDTQTYGIHFDGTQPGKATVKGCQIVGFNTFNPELNFVDCNFVDSDKNQYYVAQAWSNVSFTNCTFSEKWCAVTDYQTIGIASGNGVATLNGCTTAIGTVVDACMNSAMTGVVAIDATGNATDGFTAGSFITGEAANIKVAQGYMAKAVEGKDNVWTVAVKPAAEFNGQEYASFEAALNAAKAAKGGKVTLVDDVTLTRTDYKGCSSSDEDFATRLYTIDLNGHKISGGLFAFEDCSYTIEDSVGGGSISRDGSCLQLNVSQFMASKMCTFETCPTFTVTGGDFIGAGDLNNPYSCKYGAQIGAMGTDDHKFGVSKFLISGGKIRNMRIYNGKGEISGGTFEGQLKIEVCTESSDKYASGVTYSDFVTTITGGNFNLAETNPIFGADYAKDRLGDHLQIKGGTFNFNPSVNYSACIPAGYTSQDNGDGTWTVVAAN